MNPRFRVGLATLCWTVAFSLMAARTMMRDRPDLAILTGWGLLFGMAGLAVTGYHLLMCERNYCIAIAEAAAAAAIQQDGLRSVD